MSGRQVAHGESIRPISRYEATGSTSIVRWTRPPDNRLQAQQNTRCSRGKGFFKRATSHKGRRPHTITLEGYVASPRAVRELREIDFLPKRTKLRSSKYLNNLIEQDHRGIKSRTRPLLGAKNFESAFITIAGVELLRRIYREQFAFHRLRIKGKLRRRSGTQCLQRWCQSFA